MRVWHCGCVREVRLGAMLCTAGTAARAKWAAVALGGKPGQRHRQSASLTKGRGGIDGGTGERWKFGKRD